MEEFEIQTLNWMEKSNEKIERENRMKKKEKWWRKFIIIEQKIHEKFEQIQTKTLQIKKPLKNALMVFSSASISGC